MLHCRSLIGRMLRYTLPPTYVSCHALLQEPVLWVSDKRWLSLKKAFKYLSCVSNARDPLHSIIARVSPFSVLLLYNCGHIYVAVGELGPSVYFCMHLYGSTEESVLLKISLRSFVLRSHYPVCISEGTYYHTVMLSCINACIPVEIFLFFANMWYGFQDTHVHACDMA